MATSGQKSVTTAGTAVRLADNQPCAAVMVKALQTNTGYMYIGNDGAGDVTSANGYQLDANDSVYLEVDNLSQLWVDCSVNGESVCWILVVV